MPSILEIEGIPICTKDKFTPQRDVFWEVYLIFLGPRKSPTPIAH